VRDDPVVPRFHLLESGRVEQFLDGVRSEFDPQGWATYSGGVKAVRIPRGFRVDSEHCADGWLVYDGRLQAIPDQAFTAAYRLEAA
jgi:hypothetical protein